MCNPQVKATAPVESEITGNLVSYEFSLGELTSYICIVYHPCT